MPPSPPACVWVCLTVDQDGDASVSVWATEELARLQAAECEEIGVYYASVEVRGMPVETTFEPAVWCSWVGGPSAAELAELDRRLAASRARAQRVAKGVARRADPRFGQPGSFDPRQLTLWSLLDCSAA